VPYTDPGTGVETTIPAFGVVLNALKSNSSVNVISNPSVAAMDNEEAKIVVGSKVPFPTTSGLNNLGQPVVSFQREDVAITLEVTPRVNSSNYVTLEVKVEAQEIAEDDQGLSAAASGGPTTTKRELETVALVEDNQTMVVGGLVGSTDTEVETKVPILGDLPVLGALFRGSRTISRRTNLLIFLTPHIIDDPEDMLEIQRVKEAQRLEFLRRFYGKSRDEYMREMNDLLRYSMNFVDEPSVFRGADTVIQDLTLDDQPVSPETRDAIESELENAGVAPAGEGATPTDEGAVP
jgi:general secretion pathway protein D